MCNGVADFYRKNSRGVLILKTKSYVVDVPFDGKPANLYPAEHFAMGLHKGADFYAIVGIYTANHSGAGVSHLSSNLTSTATHEVGHLLTLGHAGAYKPNADGTVTLDAYGDGESVMSMYPSAFLTAPQYYHEGWLPRSEAVIYQPGLTYEIKRVSNFASTGITTVIVPHPMFNGGAADPKYVIGQDRDAYISFPIKCAGCAALHLGSDAGAGTQRVKIFGKEYTDSQFTGLHIKVLDDQGDTITVAIDFDQQAQQ
jgi:hypothetical protein